MQWSNKRSREVAGGEDPVAQAKRRKLLEEQNKGDTGAKLRSTPIQNDTEIQCQFHCNAGNGFQTRSRKMPKFPTLQPQVMASDDFLKSAIRKLFPVLENWLFHMEYSKSNWWIENAEDWELMCATISEDDFNEQGELDIRIVLSATGIASPPKKKPIPFHTPMGAFALPGFGMNTMLGNSKFADVLKGGIFDCVAAGEGLSDSDDANRALVNGFNKEQRGRRGIGFVGKQKGPPSYQGVRNPGYITNLKLLSNGLPYMVLGWWREKDDSVPKVVKVPDTRKKGPKMGASTAMRCGNFRGSLQEYIMTNPGVKERCVIDFQFQSDGVGGSARFICIANAKYNGESFTAVAAATSRKDAKRGGSKGLLISLGSISPEYLSETEVALGATFCVARKDVPDFRRYRRIQSHLATIQRNRTAVPQDEFEKDFPKSKVEIKEPPCFSAGLLPPPPPPPPVNKFVFNPFMNRGRGGGVQVPPPGHPMWQRGRGRGRGGVFRGRGRGVSRGRGRGRGRGDFRGRGRGRGGGRGRGVSRGGGGFRGRGRGNFRGRGRGGFRGGRGRGSSRGRGRGGSRGRGRGSSRGSSRGRGGSRGRGRGQSRGRSRGRGRGQSRGSSRGRGRGRGNFHGRGGGNFRGRGRGDFRGQGRGLNRGVPRGRGRGGFNSRGRGDLRGRSRGGFSAPGRGALPGRGGGLPRGRGVGDFRGRGMGNVLIRGRGDFGGRGGGAIPVRGGGAIPIPGPGDFRGRGRGVFPGPPRGDFQGRGRGDNFGRGRGILPGRGQNEFRGRGLVRGAGVVRGRGVFQGPVRGDFGGRGRGDFPGRGRGDFPGRGQVNFPGRGQGNLVRGAGVNLAPRGRGEFPGRGSGNLRGGFEPRGRGRGFANTNNPNFPVPPNTNNLPGPGQPFQQPAPGFPQQPPSQPPPAQMGPYEPPPVPVPQSFSQEPHSLPTYPPPSTVRQQAPQPQMPPQQTGPPQGHQFQMPQPQAGPPLQTAPMPQVVPQHHAPPQRAPPRQEVPYQAPPHGPPNALPHVPPQAPLAPLTSQKPQTQNYSTNNWPGLAEYQPPNSQPSYQEPRVSAPSYEVPEVGSNGGSSVSMTAHSFKQAWSLSDGPTI